MDLEATEGSASEGVREEVNERGSRSDARAQGPARNLQVKASVSSYEASEVCGRHYTSVGLSADLSSMCRGQLQGRAALQVLLTYCMLALCLTPKRYAVVQCVHQLRDIANYML